MESATSVDENVLGRTASEVLEASSSSGDLSAAGDEVVERPKKKRRAALTRVGDLGS